MRRALLATAALLLFSRLALAGQTLDGPSALRALLVEGHQPMQLERVDRLSGCTTTECSVQFDGLAIVPKTRTLRSGRNQSIRVLEHRSPGSPALPDMDWTPTEAYAVSLDGRRWGSCMEFSHSGVGRSGTFQRWTSIILLPWRGDHPGLAAHRLVGYWAACDQLVAGAAVGQGRLGLVQPSGASGLGLVQYRCDSRGCKPEGRPRPVAVVKQGEGTFLTID